MGTTTSFPDNGSRTIDEKQLVVAALGAPALTMTLGKRTPRPFFVLVSPVMISYGLPALIPR